MTLTIDLCILIQDKTKKQSYSDFFKRKYILPPKAEGPFVWPCEGYVCDWGFFQQKRTSLVKGNVLDLNSIFCSNPDSTKDYFFVNIFLHNHNYHRVHAPCSGKIMRITKIPGDLIFLRPWFYKNGDASYPAFRNERMVVELKDASGRIWFLSMVGGFGVGTIELHHNIDVGSTLQAGEEMALFKLGSTVCLAIPEAVQIDHHLQAVSVGKNLLSIGKTDV